MFESQQNSTYSHASKSSLLRSYFLLQS
jgi:hypothetical protein